MSIKPLFELDLNGSATTSIDQVTDGFGLADCQELLTFYLYFGQSKTSRRESVKIYLVDQRGPATVRNYFELGYHS